MHFTKTVLLFAGIAAAAPIAASTGSVASSSSSAQGTAPAALSSAVLNDINAWVTSIDGALSAVNAFTGGPSIAAQGFAVAAAGDGLLRTTSQLISDTRTLSNYGPIEAVYSAMYTDLITNYVAGNLIRLFQALQNKKALFNQVGAAKDMVNGISALSSMFLQLADIEELLLTESDMDKVHNAAINIFIALQSAVQAYSS